VQRGQGFEVPMRTETVYTLYLANVSNCCKLTEGTDFCPQLSKDVYRVLNLALGPECMMA